MNSFSKKALGFGMAAVMLASGGAVPASAVGTSDAAVSAASAQQMGSLSRPKIKKTKRGSGAVNLTWNKVNKATGYKVYMKTADGWKCKAVVKGGTKLSAKVQGLNSKTKYTFKVQAYKKSKGKTYYSKFSAPVTVETKYGLGKSNYTSKEFDMKWSTKKWQGEMLFDALFTLTYRGDENIPAGNIAIIATAGPHNEETKGKTIEEFIEKALSELNEDDKITFRGYTTIDGVKFAVIDEENTIDNGGNTTVASITHEYIGFTKQSVHTIISGYYPEQKDAAEKVINGQLKKLDIKK